MPAMLGMAMFTIVKSSSYTGANNPFGNEREEWRERADSEAESLPSGPRVTPSLDGATQA